MCLLNGRVTPERDNFTSITKHGMSVIDYWITGYESLETVKCCEVIPVSDFVENIGLETGPKLSDHSLVLIRINICVDLMVDCDIPNCDITDCDMNETSQQPATEEVRSPTYEKPTKFRVGEVPSQFMDNDRIWGELEGLIDDLLKVKQNQERIDEWYSCFLHTLYGEIDRFFKQFADAPKSRKNYMKMAKPWWSD